jgi:small subunit ribosomal protein S9
MVEAAKVEAAKVEPAKVESSSMVWGTGRRKTAIARVRLVAGGKGTVLINNREMDKYFFSERERNYVWSPLRLTKTINKYDVFVSVSGGGLDGQAGAVMLGIARALMKIEPALESALRDAQLLTRDGRMKERKKYGLRGARRGTQFSKR